MTVVSRASVGRTYNRALTDLTWQNLGYRLAVIFRDSLPEDEEAFRDDIYSRCANEYNDERRINPCE